MSSLIFETMLQMLLSLLLICPSQKALWDNFDNPKQAITLPSDHRLEASQLTSDSLTVYVFLEDECMISQFYTNELGRLYALYQPKHVGFVGYFPSPTTGQNAIDSFGIKYKLKFPMFPDHDKIMTKKLGVTITPEVAVWDHRANQQIYLGRIDDSYVRVGKRKLHPQSHDLEDMIKEWLSDQTPGVMVKTQAIGCFISFTE